MADSAKTGVRRSQPPIHLEVQDAVTGRRHTLRPIGELDLASAPHLDRMIESAHAAGAEAITIDLTGLTFMDCCGLRSVMSATKAPEFDLVPGRGQVHRLFELIDLLDVFPVARPS
jgi:anti-anti-sigma factor